MSPAAAAGQIPLLAVLAFVVGLSVALIFKLTGPQILEAFTGRASATASPPEGSLRP